MKKIKGFTLVEILVVMAILLLMIVILIGILNPIALVNKARDSRRKKDLNRIKVAFEEYYNDKGCYPNESTWRPLLMEEEYCGTNIFENWLRPWPCDPNGNPYEIQVGYDEDCPEWYKILTVLENKNDLAINIIGVSATYYNYGVSSGNISPGDYLGDNDPNCARISSSDDCYRMSDTCETTVSCVGPNCFSKPNCREECRVSSCVQTP